MVCPPSIGIPASSAIDWPPSNILLKKLNAIEGIQAFYKTDDGYEVAGPEGFVAIDHVGGAVKLIDRLVFSRRNFLAGG